MGRRLYLANFEKYIATLSICLLLFAKCRLGSTPGFLKIVAAPLTETNLQWMPVFCLGFYLTTLLIIELRKVERMFQFRARIATCFLFVFCLIALLRYAFLHDTAWRSTSLLVMLFGLLAGKAAVKWTYAHRTCHDSSDRLIWLLGTLIFCFGSVALWPPDLARPLYYRGILRWTGPWNNPNLYGSLMGVGIILAGGVLISRLQGRIPYTSLKTPAAGLMRSLFETLCLISGCACLFGLVKSYSRGAWLGTVCGLGYLFWRHMQDFRFIALGHSSAPERRVFRLIIWVYRNWKSLILISFCGVILAFWQFRFTNWPPARRVFSVANMNDLSWRNRLTAWRGAFGMIKDRPWIGVGWGQTDSVYEEKYRPIQIEDAQVLHTNSFFVLGASVGVPALLCLVSYLFLTLSPMRRQNSKEGDSFNLADSGLEPLRITCHAGAFALLIGFWLDGTMFELPTAFTFWILLELGRAVPCERRQNGEASIRDEGISMSEMTGLSYCVRTPPNVRLGIIAWTFAALALGQTLVCVVTPFLSVSTGTLAIARKWLVPPTAINDLDILAADPTLRGKPLGTLLQHASLARYTRELVPWRLDDSIYRQYVLAPRIDPLYDGDVNWRRTLWDFYFPVIHKESDPSVAAVVTLRILRQQMSNGHADPQALDNMWRQRLADPKGFAALSVAALRSVGIPTRLNSSGQAEMFSNGEWRVCGEL
jgi:O-antigen ligase